MNKDANDQCLHLSRRTMLLSSVGLAGMGAVASLGIDSSIPITHAASASGTSTSLPVKQIEQIMETNNATVMNGVLSIELDRNDLPHVIGPHGIPFKPAWELNGQFYFQPLGNGQALLNGDFPVLPEEANRFIDKLFAGGLVFQAFHQHFFELKPMVFFIHFRGVGDPLQLAKASIAAIKTTGTPLPQHVPAHLTTPLPTDELAHILGGTAEVGEEGIVTVSIPRANTIVLAGVPLKPETGVSVTVAFEPLDSSGKCAAVAPDYALVASEVNPALMKSRSLGWEIHCLYNQETNESPQLYFSHNLKVGDPIALAREISQVLERINVKRS